MGALSLVTAPTSEPITLAAAKLHLRVDTADDDALIYALINVARSHAETITRRALITQTWKLTLDSFYGWELSITPSAVQSITHIKYIDTNGDQITLAAADYLVDKNTEPCRITPAYGKVWPTTREQMNAVEIQFVAGYGAAVTVPEPIKTWMLLTIATLYKQRDVVVTGTLVQSIPDAFYDNVLSPYIVRSA